MKENHRILGDSSSRSLDNDNNHVVVQLCNGLRTRMRREDIQQMEMGGSFPV